MEYYPRVRKRQSIATSGTYVSTYVPGGTSTTGEYSITTGQETRDAEHSWYKYRRFLDEGDVAYGDMGGPFYSKHYRYEEQTNIYSPYHRNSAGVLQYTYDGPQFAKTPIAYPGKVGAWEEIEPSTDEELDAYGTTAISRVAPTNPHSSVFTALGELYRDGLPAAIGLNAIKRKSLEDEYLNYEFGILPTIGDIKSIADSYIHADNYLRQYYRDSGKIIRRRYAFPSEVKVVSDTTTTALPQPVLNTFLYSSTQGKLRKLVTEETHVWFSGAFTYHAQEPNSALAIRDQVQKWNSLYGITPSPEAIWNLLPYSWAADWITNIGDVMNNVSMCLNDGLVLRHGYVMEHKVHRVEYTQTGTVLKPNLPVFASQVFTTETKRRRRATPFGFGLELNGFTDRQWAILAALGISRGRGAL